MGTSHALVNGFHEGKHFSSVMTIIDPDADDRHRVSVFMDLELGARVLAVMRADAAKKLKAAQRKSSPKRRSTNRRKRTA